MINKIKEKVTISLTIEEVVELNALIDRNTEKRGKPAIGVLNNVCPVCGAIFTVGDNYCPKCGQKVAYFNYGEDVPFDIEG